MAKIQLSGNLLGGPRAEIDKTMLSEAFIKTHDFQALVSTRDFNFVVGRRGTGKSALFFKVAEYLREKKVGYVYCHVPQEYEQLELQSHLKQITENYRLVRAITRVAWRAGLLIDLLGNIHDHYKFKDSEDYEFLTEYIDKNTDIIEFNIFKKTTEIIKKCYKNCEKAEELPGKIASEYLIESLHSAVNNSLLTINKSIYFLFDGLDEGWTPTEIATAVLGGLASCASDILDKQSEIHLLLFVRDNIFRSLNYFDKDFSRHIEGNTIRLTWDDQSLLYLVANRLRVSLGLESVENNIKVWNRFAQADLKNQDGFRSCLSYTLFRPRDIIVLLNTTFTHVTRSGRHEIVKEDIELSSKQISKNRLNDLLKEYDIVFPGLTLLVDAFKGKPAFQSYSEVVALLELEIYNNKYQEEEASDFALLGSGNEAFFALYSVGFLGLESAETSALQFCHDGSPAQIDAIKSDQRSCVHPCYWKALSIQSELIEENILIQIYDDNQPTGTTDLSDLRTKRIGQIVSKLPMMEEGIEHAAPFEEWALQAIQILFSGKLTNAELKPNGDAIQRRDIVATNNATMGFWKRIREDFNSRQIVFEIKNFSALKIDNFRQALSYSGTHYGTFITIIYRNQNEGLSPVERGWVQEFWHNHHVLIFLLPAQILSRCISKLRTKQRFEYSEKLFEKRLDTYLRSYLSIKHNRNKSSKKVASKK
jgi:hypothetical protein